MPGQAVLTALAALLATAALAGCAQSGADGEAPDAAEGAQGGGGLVDAAPLDAASVVQAPTWAVGQWWEWQATFGTEVASTTFCSIVVDAGTRLLATEKTDQAKHEAAFGHPLLGALGPQLQMTGFGGEWDLLDFPLQDGKTWTATLPNIAWDTQPDDGVQAAMTATFDAALPGYRITGTAEGAGTILQATYLPSTGWFGQIDFYDTDPGQEGLEVGYTAVTAGLNYTGPYFLDTATLLAEFVDGSGLDAPPPEGQPFVEPHPEETFTMAAGTILYGGLVAESVFGTRAITLTDPAGAQRQVVSSGGPDGDQQVLFLDEASQAGEWRIVTAGAGGFNAAFVELYELTEGAFTL